MHSIDPERNKIVYKNKSLNTITSPIRRMQHRVMYTAECVALQSKTQNATAYVSRPVY